MIPKHVLIYESLCFNKNPTSNNQNISNVFNCATPKKQGSIETSNIIQLHTLKAFCRNNSHETRTRRLSALWHAVAGSWSRRQTWNSVLVPEMALKLARLTQKPSTPSLRQWESTRWMAIGYCSAITLAAWSDAGRAQSSRTSAWIVCQAFAFY